VTQTVNSGRQLDHGDRVRVEIHDQGGWREWFTGEFLTVENLGQGPRARIKGDKSGNHIHVPLRADDHRAVRVEDGGRDE